MNLLNLLGNEIRDFLKNKSNIIIMFIFPLIIIFIMGNSINGFMNIEKNIFDNKIVYYKVESIKCDNADLERFYDFMISFEKKTNIKFISVENSKEAKKKVNLDKAICFIDIYESDIKYFRNEKEECIESKIFRNLYEQYLRRYTFLDNITSKKNFNNNLQNNNMKIFLINQKAYIKDMDAFTYYTFSILILMIIYISNYILISTYKRNTKFFSNKLGIVKLKKYIISEKIIVLSKIFLGMFIGILEILIVYISSRYFFNIYWGTNIVRIFLVLICFIIFSTVLGIFIGVLFRNKNTAYIINNIIIIVVSYIGGLYVPIYLIKYNNLTSSILDFIPTYWTNLSILSLKYNLNNQYYIRAISISLGLSVIMLIISNLILKLREGDTFA